MSIKYFPNNEKPDLSSVDENGKFVDKTFPHNIDSLFNMKNHLIDYSKYPDLYEEYKEEYKKEKEETENKIKKYEMKWKRISDLITKEADEENKDVPINQNELGDCYFISFLRGLKYFQPDTYYSLIRYFDFNKGYYEINFFDKNGDEIVVYVDDYILMYPNTIPFFASIKKDEQYKIGRYLLIEKAFAKMNGCYFNINGGYQGINGSFAVAGINPIKLEESFFSLDENSIYKMLKAELNANNVVISGTKNPIYFKGLYENHMYTVLNVDKTDDEIIKIIELENPWGNNEEKDIEEFSLNLEKKYKFYEISIKDYNKENVDNGKIKILIKNLKENFEYIEICEFNSIEKDIKKEIKESPKGTPPWIPGNLNIFQRESIKRRRGILDILGVNSQDQQIFFNKYRRDIDKGFTDLTKCFVKYGTSKNTFDTFLNSFSNSGSQSNEQSSGFFSMLNPYNLYNKFFK